MFNKKKKVFSALMEQHKGIIHKVVNAYCADPDEKQDLTQEILTAMWLVFDQYNNEFKFSTWMYRIALNIAISYYRKSHTRQVHVVSCDDTVNQTIKNVEHSDNSEELQQIYVFIHQLNKLNKAVMLLFLAGESNESTAHILGLSQSNVSTRINRIKNKLKQHFTQKAK